MEQRRQTEKNAQRWKKCKTFGKKWGQRLRRLGTFPELAEFLKKTAGRCGKYRNGWEIMETGAEKGERLEKAETFGRMLKRWGKYWNVEKIIRTLE